MQTTKSIYDLTLTFACHKRFFKIRKISTFCQLHRPTPGQPNSDISKSTFRPKNQKTKKPRNQKNDHRDHHEISATIRERLERRSRGPRRQLKPQNDQLHWLPCTSQTCTKSITLQSMDGSINLQALDVGW